MSTNSYTVLLKLPQAASDDLPEAIQRALQSIDGVSADLPTEVSTLGLNKKEFLLTTLVSFNVSIMANFATEAIKLQLQDALQGDPATQPLVVEDVIPESNNTDAAAALNTDCQ